MEDALTVEKHREGEIGIITAKGDVDMGTLRPLRDAVREVAADGAVHIVLDMRQVDYMDSSGMSIIMTARKLTSEHNGEVYLIFPIGSAGRALELVKAHHLVEVADSPEEAVKALNGGA
ncbi:MAG: STAS domain-containing protein [Armatimonadetes bacterium]|nr:STAS domain-containing protein [Armatimonadota bacterium]